MPRSDIAAWLVRLLVLGCLATIFAGPWYTEPGYDWLSHSVSELAGQRTHNAWVMRLGLIALGLASILGYLAFRPGFNLLFAAFGLLIGMSAFFPHKPFVADRPYSELLDQLHSAFASLGGLCAVLGFALKARDAGTTATRYSYALTAAAYTLLPLLMFSIPAWQGLFQRALFVSYGAWACFDGVPCAGTGKPDQPSG